jgi:4a-hydroxytetrahydrobiopterin dehydratase
MSASGTLHGRGATPREAAMTDLASTPIRPVPEGTPPLAPAEAGALLSRLGADWQVVDGKKLRKTYRFRDFAGALEFVNQVGHMADNVDHHPDVHLAWGKATIEIWTHTVGGLHAIDFAFAARCDHIAAHDDPHPAEP